ncbi:MAG: heavy metal translocating P-type ATPase [Gammaproteobacteria bacterium]
MNKLAQFCYHCGLPNEQGTAYPVEIAHQTHHMCCPGCQAVAESIVSMGLADYYQFREKLPEISPRDMTTDKASLVFYDHDKVQQKYVQSSTTDDSRISLIITGIVCSACTWLIESRISKLNGIHRITVNQSTNRATVEWDPKLIQLSDILAAINALGYQAQPYDRAAKEQALITQKKRYLQKLAVAGLGMMQVMMYSLGFYLDSNQEMSESTWQLLRWVSLFISTPVVLYAASPFYLSAFKSLRNKVVNMDVPVTIAIIAAWLASVYATLVGVGEVYFDSVSMFVFFLLTGRYLQMMAIHKSGRALEERLGSQPETALRLLGNQHERVLLEDVEAGDVLIVKPASQVPCDGLLLESSAEVNESILTGESTPVLKSQEQLIAAGSINSADTFHIKVTDRVENSTLASIIRLLQNARETKPRIQEIADRVASYFVLGILLLTTLTALYWYYTDSTMVFATVLAVLVVTCPCALSLATPVAITTAIGHLTSRAVLLNRSSALFNLNQATDFVFDKTGTLTTGRFQLQSFNNHSDMADDALLALVATIESQSEHPIATAFSEFETANFAISDVKRIAGVGLSVVINGDVYQLGNNQLLTDDAAKTQSPEIHLYLLKNDQLQAEFIVTTEIRPEAAALIRSLQERKLAIHLLSGDKSAHVAALAEKLHIPTDTVLSGVSPSEKLAYIEQLQVAGKLAVMVGDGINDSPAMAAASVSIAMTEATDITKVNADMILMRESLTLIEKAYQLSLKTRQIIKQNIVWAISYNLIGVPLAMAGLLTPWIAALGMSFSSLIVILNALRLAKK